MESNAKKELDSLSKRLSNINLAREHLAKISICQRIILKKLISLIGESNSLAKEKLIPLTELVIAWGNQFEHVKTENDFEKKLNLLFENKRFMNQYNQLLNLYKIEDIEIMNNGKLKFLNFMKVNISNLINQDIRSDFLAALEENQEKKGFAKWIF